MAQKLLEKGNFYTSYELALSLLENKTHLVGTLRANKKDIPKTVLEAKLKRGELISNEDKNGVVILKWKDTHDVRVLTTKHALIIISQVQLQDANQPYLFTSSNQNIPPSSINHN